jgi:hypothetical protein
VRRVMLRATKFSVLAAVAAACAIGASSASAAWTVVSGTPPSTAAQLNGVACTSTTFCVLVGPQSSPSAYALKWNGSALSSLTAASSTSEFDGVGCNSSTLCFASGTDTSTRGPKEESFNGSAFSASTSTTPSGATFTQLSGTACPGSTSCFSVGQYTSSGGTTQPVIEHWTGSSWGTMSMTLPSGATTAALSDVACTSTTACTATGWYTDSSGTQFALILRWNGTSWTSQTGATITGATAAELDGVSCTSSTSCNAVGSYTDAASVQHELAETWNGTTWSQKSVPAVSGAVDAALSDVSCYTTSSAGCVAVGSYTDAGGNVQPEVAGYNGTSYAQQTISRPASTTDTTLNGVSCTSSTFCMIAGTATYTSTGVGPVAYKGP